MKITENLLTPNVYSRPQTKLTKITKVVVHYVGNPKSTAIANRNYFNNAPSHKTKVSSHYVVGLQGEVIRCIPENEVAYCSNQANSYSISIETCHPDVTGKFNTITEQSLVELVADICKRHKLNPAKDVIRHYDVTGKCCPMWYVKNPVDWEKFKQRVSAELAPTPQKQGKWCIGNFNEDTKGRADVKVHLDALKAIGYGVWYEEAK